MNAFTPPVPAIPAEHRSPLSSPQTDSVTDGYRTVDPRKPLPSILQSPSMMRDSEELDEKSIVFVDKAMPPLPPSTPVRPTAPPMSKRRSMSVSDVDPTTTPTTPIVVSPPTLKAANSRRNEGGPAQSGESTLPNLLDLFKGDPFEPFSGSSLDLREISTPARPSSHISKTEGSILGSQETTNKAEKQESKSAISDPFGGVPNTADGNASLFPPRTSSLKSPARNSVMGAQQLTALRQAAPSRSRTAPTNSTQTLTPRSAGGMRHHSSASISEPSLVPSLGDSLHREFFYFHLSSIFCYALSLSLV
jgi:hypothetical protein